MHLKVFLFTLFLPLLISTDNVESFDLKDYRLPTWAFPDHYYINIDLRNPEADTFRGYTWININVTEENHQELVLNVDPLYIDVNSSTITVDETTFICDKVDYSKETTIMALTCVYDMYSIDDKLAQFEMYYTAKFSETPAGLYKHIFNVNGTRQSVIYSQFETTNFRRVFPSFDEPSFKTSFTLSVDHELNLTVVSNMLDTEPFDPVRHTIFRDTPRMSSYLVAVVAGPSDVWTHLLIPGAENFRIFRQQIHENYISIVSQNAPTLLDKMGEWTGIKYKDLGNPKMTFAALPGMGGAMENWGLITFGEVYLIDEGDRTSSKAILNSLPVMAHELAHQWFGDYVTLNWWSETWLNEGFASYFQWYLANMLSTDDNDYEFDKLFIIRELQSAFQSDGPDASPLSNNDTNVNTQVEIQGSFSTVAYNKGGSVLRMLRYALGENIFQKGTQEYLKANALGNTKATEYIKHLQTALPNDTDIDLSTYMNSWIYQPGYPVVRTSFGETAQNIYSISIDIYKFSTSLNKTGDPEQSIWWVPISYITSDNPDPANATYFWINPGRTFGYYIPKTDDSWGIVNADASGFYRVDYDSTSLGRIINVLNDSSTYQNIPTVNRAQLLDDLFNVAKYYTDVNEARTHRPYENAFKLSQYLVYETEYIPWYTFLREVDYLLYEIQDELTKDKLKEYVLALLEPQLVIPDHDNSTQLPHSEVLKRNLLLLWASKVGHNETLEYVKRQFNNFLKDPNSVDSNYRDVVLCYGIQNSNDKTKDYSTLTNIYDKSILPQEQLDLAVGMACMDDSDLLKSYLELFLTAEPSIDKQYWSTVFQAVYSQSSEGLDAALAFLISHGDEIRQRLTPNIGSLFSAVASKIVKPKDIEILKDLLKGNSLNPDVTKAVEVAIKKAEFNVEWIDKFGTEICSIVVYNGGIVPSITTTTTEKVSTTTTEEVVSTTTTTGKAVNVIHNLITVFLMLVLSFLFK